jgi:hypothetical protein
MHIRFSSKKQQESPVHAAESVSSIGAFENSSENMFQASTSDHPDARVSIPLAPCFCGETTLFAREGAPRGWIIAAHHASPRACMLIFAN